MQKMGISPTYEPCCGFCIHSARAVGLVTIGTMGKCRKSNYLKTSCIISPLQDCSEALGTDHWHWSDPLKKSKVSLPFLQHGKAHGACTLGFDVAGLWSLWWKMEFQQWTPRIPEASSNLKHSGEPLRGLLIYRAVFEWWENGAPPQNFLWMSMQNVGCAVQGHNPKWARLLHLCAFSSFYFSERQLHLPLFISFCFTTSAE